jgi:hypothetical protein
MAPLPDSKPMSAEERIARVLKAFVADHPELAADAEAVLEQLAPKPAMTLIDVLRAVGKAFFEGPDGAAADTAIRQHLDEHAALMAAVNPPPVPAPGDPAPQAAAAVVPAPETPPAPMTGPAPSMAYTGPGPTE